MVRNKKFKPFLLFFSLIYLAGFCFFYYKYVPFIKSFQMILVPILLVILILTSVKIRWGILFFVFAFPLINNLPYFFGIHGHIPHAPTALILFLVFFSGWMLNKSFSYSKSNVSHPVFRPLIFLSLIVFVSGIITFFRYTNFSPFVSDKIYELIVNVNGVRTGGALMSDIFNCLNYLTGFVFFFMLFNSIKSIEFIKKILIVLSFSALILLIFSLVQKYYSIRLGNSPFWVRINQINSTFKDPNSFGLFISAYVPVLLGMAFLFRKQLKIFFLFLIILTLFIFPATGSRSGLLALIISVIAFFILSLISYKTNLKKKIVFITSFLLILIFLFLSFLVLAKQSNLNKRINQSLDALFQRGSLRGIFKQKLDFWAAASKMIKDYPLTGLGMGAFIIDLPLYLKLLGLPFKHTDSAENYFFQVGAELGLIGLFLVFWLFFEIIKQMRRSWKKISSDDKNRFILIGAISGLVSIFVNFFFHSYVGAFDVKYFFWFLIALVFIYSGANGKPKIEAKLNHKFMYIAVIFVLFFSAVHLWNSTHSLSLKSRTEQFGLIQNFGLDKLEKTNDGREFRWTRSYGGLPIRIEKPVIEIPLLASHPDIRRNPVKVKIYLIKDFFKKKKLLDEIILTESIWKSYEYDIPEEVNQEVILLIKVSRTWNPLKVTGAPDPRNLGVAVGKIQFKENKIRLKEKGNQKEVI